MDWHAAYLALEERYRVQSHKLKAAESEIAAHEADEPCPPWCCASPEYGQRVGLPALSMDQMRVVRRC